MNPENEERTTAAATTGETVASSSSTANVGNNNKGGKLKPTSTFIGRHRLQAAISHLEQQIKIIQDELNELETMGGPSTVCDEFISGIESVPDPLLPMTKGPVDVNWERWFGGGGSSSRSHRRWI